MASKASVLGAIAISLAFLVPSLALAAEVKEDATAAGAKDPLEMYVSPASENGATIEGLYNIIWWLAIVVFVAVEGLLFYVVWKFRKNRTVPKGETHRGHTQAEIFWTLVPALIFIFIGVISVQAMRDLDTIPEEAALASNTIDVEASQFAWKFTYPDGSSDANQMWVEVGHKYQLNVRSVDVLHAIWIPAYGLKLDAVPGRTNHAWFEPAQTGEFFIQCAEFCKVGHHGMHAKLFVFEKGQNGTTSITGAPPGAKLPKAACGENPADARIDVRLVERAAAGGPGPFGIEPPTLTATAGSIELCAINDGAGLHNLAVEGKGKSADLKGGESTALLVSLEPGTYTYICAIAGHKELGMQGTLTVT